MLVSLALWTGNANACGGFACDAAQPVLQAAERIVFGIDDANGLVEMHVQITYEGPADDFAWIVPVAHEPELFLTTSALFTQLAVATQPLFTLFDEEEGHCRTERSKGGDSSSSDTVATDVDMAGGSYDTSSQFDVDVVGTETVGPYETVTLRADSSEDLIGWLQAQGYALPETLEDVLSPYVVRDAYFVALKLGKDQDAGDLAPLAMRFAATKASVPVQLTAVSATPDMRMEAYVLSDGRGVPESYLHVQINDAALDWWQAGTNYDDVITQAANEAGGHAFATDYFGDAGLISPLWRDSTLEADLRAQTDVVEWLTTLVRGLVLVPSEAASAVEEALGLTAGTGVSALACPSCFDDLPEAFDVTTATDVVVERLLEPLAAAQALLDRHPKLARMTSSLDAAEMTVDPVFVVNRDMAGEDVRRLRNATQVFECGLNRLREKAPRRLDLADGRQIEIPSQEWMSEHGMSEFEYIAELGETKAQVIEQMGADGQPETVADFTDDLFELVDLHNRSVGCTNGGGCSTSGTRASALLMLGALAVARRRR